MFTNTFLSVILQMTVAHPNLHGCHRDGKRAVQKQHKGKVKAGASAEEALLVFLDPAYYTSDSIRDTTLLPSGSALDVQTKTVDTGSGTKELWSSVFCLLGIALRCPCRPGERV